MLELIHIASNERKSAPVTPPRRDSFLTATSDFHNHSLYSSRLHNISGADSESDDRFRSGANLHFILVRPLDGHSVTLPGKSWNSV
jgi:hypothetical protein